MPNAPTDLPDNDKALIEAVREGRVWSAVDELPTPEQLADPTFVATMPTIQATTIRALCLGLWDDVIADPRGVQVTGARIEGKLDLSFGTGRCRLALRRCHFAEELVVQNTHLPALNLSGSHLVKGLKGNGVHVEGDFFCRNGFTSKDAVRLHSARIGGSLCFDAATLDCRTGSALIADGIIINGGLFCGNGFKSIGQVRLLRAQIDRAVEFHSAAIDGRMGHAFCADGIALKGSLFFGNGSRSDGQIRLLGAHIEGSVVLHGATLNGGKGDALTADGMTVTGSVFCRNKFEFIGNVSFVGVKIGGLLDWIPTESTGVLDLSHATSGLWGDDWEGHEEHIQLIKRINLNHFTYRSFVDTPEMKTDSATRIAWIEASQGDDFKPNPYRTLARVLRAAGDDRGAKDVGHAMEKARAKHRAKSCHWSWRWSYRLLMFLFNVAVGYGYRPQWGAGWLSGWLIFGSLFFYLGAPTPYGGPGLIKPADPVFITENQTRNLQAPSPTAHDIAYTLPPEYTPFNAFWYSFDTLIPLIDLGQEKAWSPSPLTAKFSDDIPGWFLLFYLYFHIIMGWVLSTLTVVALTGLIKRDPEGEE